jgi:hypothetical protein
MPVLVADAPGVTIPLETRFPVMVPPANSDPPDRVTPPDAAKRAAVRGGARGLRVTPGPPTVNVLPVPTVTVPAFETLPAVVKLAPLARVNLPAASLVAKFASPFFRVVVLRISADLPVRVMAASFVSILAPANSSLPVTS